MSAPLVGHRPPSPLASPPSQDLSAEVRAGGGAYREMILESGSSRIMLRGQCKGRAKATAATYWSAAMELSLHSEEIGRVHLHAYFSWHGPGARGVDSRTTDAWVFQKTRPRVDVNNEQRPYGRTTIK